MSDRRIPVISMWQPWATLFVTGKKQNETRNRPLPSTLRNRWVAIHATLHTPPADLSQAWGNRHIVEALAHFGITRYSATGTPGSLPQRAIVGLVQFRDDLPTADLVRTWMARRVGTVWNYHDEREYAMGNYGPGRFAWRAHDQRINLNSYPVQEITGRQGVWYLSDHDRMRLLARIAEAQIPLPVGLQP